MTDVLNTLIFPRLGHWRWRVPKTSHDGYDVRRASIFLTGGGQDGGVSGGSFGRPEGRTFRFNNADGYGPPMSARNVPVTPGEIFDVFVGGFPVPPTPIDFDASDTTYPEAFNFADRTGVSSQLCGGGYGGGGDGFCIGAVNPETGHKYQQISAGSGATDLRRGGEANAARVLVAAGSPGAPWGSNATVNLPVLADPPISVDDSPFFYPYPDMRRGSVTPPPDDSVPPGVAPASLAGLTWLMDLSAPAWFSVTSALAAAAGTVDGIGGDAGYLPPVAFGDQNAHSRPPTLQSAGGGGYVGGASIETLLFADGVWPDYLPDNGPGYQVGQDYISTVPSYPGSSLSRYPASTWVPDVPIDHVPWNPVGYTRPPVDPDGNPEWATAHIQASPTVMATLFPLDRASWAGGDGFAVIQWVGPDTPEVPVGWQVGVVGPPTGLAERRAF